MNLHQDQRVGEVLKVRGPCFENQAAFVGSLVSARRTPKRAMLWL